MKMRTHPTFIPTDVARGAADFHTFATIILHSRRPHRVSVYSARMVPLFVEELHGTPERLTRTLRIQR